MCIYTHDITPASGKTNRVSTVNLYPSTLSSFGLSRFPAGYDLFISVLPGLLTTSDCHLQCVVTKCTIQTKASSVAAVASSCRKTAQAAAGAPLSTTRTSPSAAAARSTASRTHPSVERSRSEERDPKEHLSFLRMTIDAVF